MRQTMKAAVFKGPGKLEFEERPIPEIEQDDDVVLEVGGVGICGTDVHALNVPPEILIRPNVTMGHEFAGRIAAVGKGVASVHPGDHVLVDQNAACGACEMCRKGLPNACIPLYQTPGFPNMPNTYGLWRDGALAKYARVKERNVIGIAKHVPMWQVATAEPIACALNGCAKVKLQPGEIAAVLGAGPIGLLYISILKSSGASRIIAVEPSPRRQQAALACGAAVVLDPRTVDVEQRILEETGGLGADVVIEAVGPTIDMCIKVAAPGGRIVQFGHDESAVVAIPPARICTKELQIFGVFLAKFTFEPAKKLLEAGTLPLDQIVTHRLPLDEVHQGIDLARRGEAIKVIIHPNDF